MNLFDEYLYEPWFQLMRQCEDEELMEVVLPRLAKVITLWEFLLCKVERGQPSRPNVGEVYKEFTQLHKKVQSADRLIPPALLRSKYFKQHRHDKNVLGFKYISRFGLSSEHTILAVSHS